MWPRTSPLRGSDRISCCHQVIVVWKAWPFFLSYNMCSQDFIYFLLSFSHKSQIWEEIRSNHIIKIKSKKAMKFQRSSKNNNNNNKNSKIKTSFLFLSCLHQPYFIPSMLILYCSFLSHSLNTMHNQYHHYTLTITTIKSTKKIKLKPPQNHLWRCNLILLLSLPLYSSTSPPQPLLQSSMMCLDTKLEIDPLMKSRISHFRIWWWLWLQVVMVVFVVLMGMKL